MKSKIPSFIAVLIMTLVTTIAWVGFTIYRAVTAKPAPVVAKEIIEPLDPKLDADLIRQILGKSFLSESEIPQTQISTSPAGSPSPITLPTESPAASPSPTPLSTGESIATSTPTAAGQTP